MHDATPLPLIHFTGSPSLFADLDWQILPGSVSIVTGENNAGKTYLGALLTDRVPLVGCHLSYAPSVTAKDIGWVTFDQQGHASGADWAQARWHASIDYDFSTVRDKLNYRDINGINPFEVRDPEPEREAAFARRLPQVSHMLTLEPLLDRWVVQLSNGEMRRLLIAQALLKLPKVLILDDPFAGLDPAMQKQLHEVLNLLHEEGLTLIIMTRHPDEIPTCATHHLQLSNCQLVSLSPIQVPNKPTFGDTLLPTGFTNPPPLDTPPVIEINHLTLSYGNRILFDDLNWSVHAGERWLVIGPNGSGKSTLISLLTGDNPQAYANDIKIFGEQRGAGVPLWKIRSKIGHVSPEIQCYIDPTQTPLEAVLCGNVNEAGEIQSVTPAARAHALQLLTYLKIEQHADQPFGALSAGIARLALIAKAFMANPQLILLDEPCLNLDEQSRTNLLSQLSTLLDHHPTITTLCIAHRQDDIPDGFNRIFALGRPRH